MGTTYVLNAGRLSLMEFVRSQVEWERLKIVDHSTKGSVVYLACEYTDNDGNKSIIGVVCITYRDGDERGIKIVTEDMGPVEDSCPMRLINKLSPTTNEHALEWRERCRKRLSGDSRRPKPGQTIEFSSPMRFSDGTEQRRFVVTKEYYRGRLSTFYRSVQNNGLYRITNIGKLPFEIVG